MPAPPAVLAAAAATSPVPLGGGGAAAIGLLALALVAIPFLLPVVGHFDTMAHEGLHALVAAVLGFELVEVVLDRKANGQTKISAGGFGLRLLLFFLVGYLGPSAFGLGAAWLIASGRVLAVLWVAIVLLVLLFLLVSRSFGLFTVPVAVILLVLLVRWGHQDIEEFIAYLLTWFLLLSGVGTSLRHGAGADDAKELRKRTYLPRHLWALIWIAGSLAALFFGGKLLITGL
jgi:hypothetical protein